MSMKLHCLVIVSFLAYLPVGKLQSDDAQYKYYTIINKLSFNEAIDACKNQKLQLAVINNQTENNNITNALDNYVGEYDRTYWTSGKKTSSGWQWQSNGETIDYFDWGSNELSSDDGEGDCLLMTVGHFDYGSWMRAPCDEKHRVLCE